MEVRVINEQKKIDLNLNRIKRFTRNALDFLKCKGFRLDVVITDDDKLKDMNKMFYQKNTFTDILTFDLGWVDMSKKKREKWIDIAVSAEASEKRKPEEPEKELSFYILHGILHVLEEENVDNIPARHEALLKKGEEIFSKLW